MARETLDLLFLVFNYGVLPFWALLILAPHWPRGPKLVAGVAVPALLGAVYVALLAMGAGAAFTGGVEGGGFDTLEGVMRLFTSPVAVLTGWVHYLAFDLFVGAWEVRDSRRRGVPHLLVVPCLLLTLLLGPAGLLAYVLVRGISGRRSPAVAP